MAMSDHYTKIKVHALPDCSICKKHKAKYDGKTITRSGFWAYMCQECFDIYGLGLGLGLGQELILKDT